MSVRTVWRVVRVPEGDAGVWWAELAYFGVEVSVASTDPAVLGAIETAAEQAGVELERVEA